MNIIKTDIFRALRSTLSQTPPHFKICVYTPEWYSLWSRRSSPSHYYWIQAEEVVDYWPNFLLFISVPWLFLSKYLSWGHATGNWEEQMLWTKWYVWTLLNRVGKLERVTDWLSKLYSRSLLLAVLSVLPLASRSSFGWNYTCMEVTKVIHHPPNIQIPQLETS